MGTFSKPQTLFRSALTFSTLDSCQSNSSSNSTTSLIFSSDTPNLSEYTIKTSTNRAATTFLNHAKRCAKNIDN